jgi:hypothetical protein
MLAPAGIPGEDCVGVNVPEMVTDDPSEIELDVTLRLRVDEPRKLAMSVWAAFMRTVYDDVVPTFVPSSDQ